MREDAPVGCSGDANDAGAVTLTPLQMVVTAPPGSGGSNPITEQILSGWVQAMLATLLGGIGLVAREVQRRRAILHCRGLVPRFLDKQRWR